MQALVFSKTPRWRLCAARVQSECSCLEPWDEESGWRVLSISISGEWIRKAVSQPLPWPTKATCALGKVSLGDSLDRGWEALYQNVSQGLHLACCCVLSQKKYLAHHDYWMTEWMSKNWQWEQVVGKRENVQGRWGSGSCSQARVDQGCFSLSSALIRTHQPWASLQLTFGLLASPEWQLTNQRYCDNELPNDPVLLLLSKHIFD